MPSGLSWSPEGSPCLVMLSSKSSLYFLSYVLGTPSITLNPSQDKSNDWVLSLDHYWLVLAPPMLLWIIYWKKNKSLL